MSMQFYFLANLPSASLAPYIVGAISVISPTACHQERAEARGSHDFAFWSGPILTCLNSSLTTWGPRRLLGLVVLKLNVQTVLDPNLHLDGRVQLWVCAECVNYNVHLFDNIIEAAADGGSEEVPEGDGRVVKEYSWFPDAV